MRKIFILDDIRNVKTALVESGQMGMSYRDKHVPEAVYSLARNPDDAYSIIRASSKFDIWILDNDLGIIDGISEEGYGFLKTCINEFGDKVPDTLYSCSANPVRRQQIEDLHANWLANGRQPLDPA